MFTDNSSVKVLSPSLNYDEIMAEAGLDFIPEKRPLYFYTPALDADGNEVKDDEGNVKLALAPSTHSMAVVHNGIDLGTVGLKYGLVPYNLAFHFVEDMCADGAARIKAAAKIANGAKAFLILETDDAINLGSGLVIKNTFMLMSSHDGSCKVTGRSIPYSVSNGVVLPVPGSDFNIEVKHTASAESRLVDVKKTMKNVRVAWEESEEVFKKAVTVVISPEEAVEFLHGVFGEPKSTRLENIFNKVLGLWQGEGLASRHPSCRNTLFGMVMAVGEYCDRFKTVRQSKKVNEDEARLLATLTGEAARQKATAFGLMYRMMHGD